MSYGRYVLEGIAHDAAAARSGRNGLELSVSTGNERRTVIAVPAGDLVHVDGRTYRVRTARAPGGHEIHVDLNGEMWTVATASPLEKSSEIGGGSGTLVTAVPGQIVAVRVCLGDRVREGDELIVLESMKVYSHIAAPFSGTIVELAVSEGATVAKGSLLVRLEPEAVMSPEGSGASD